MYTFSPNTIIESAKINSNFTEITSGLTSGVILGNGSGSWFGSTGTWSYVSATSFSVPTADAAKMTAGTRIKLTQSTIKYFTVSGVSGTTVSIDTTTDYTLVNAAITSAYSSNDVSPPGFPDYFAYTPTWTNLTIGNGVNNSEFCRVGKTIFFRIKLIFGSTTATSGTAANFSLPVTMQSGSLGDNDIFGMGTLLDVGVAAYIGWCRYSSTTVATVIVGGAASSYLSQNGLVNNVPFTWGTGDIVALTGFYKAA